jgi:hypothetical protein
VARGDRARGPEERAERIGQSESRRQIRARLRQMEGHLREMEGHLRALDEHLRHEEAESERWHREWDDPPGGG